MNIEKNDNKIWPDYEKIARETTLEKFKYISNRNLMETVLPPFYYEDAFDEMHKDTIDLYDHVLIWKNGCFLMYVGETPHFYLDDNSHFFSELFCDNLKRD